MNVQIKYISYVLLVFSLLFHSCGKDNYDEPNATISGQITVDGKPIGLRGTGEVVQLQLFQDGYELNAHIPVYVGQDGSFKAKVFDGKYRLRTRSNNGPWLNSTEELAVDLKGNAEVNFEVTPYFMLENVNIALNAAKEITSSFTISKEAEGASLNYYMLLISKTSFVDDGTNIFRKDYSSPDAGAISLAEDVSTLKELAGTGPLFARIGVRADGADQAIFSEVIKIK